MARSPHARGLRDAHFRAGHHIVCAVRAGGVGYADWLPWQAGAAAVAAALGGLGYKYVKEALDWTEDPE